MSHGAAAANAAAYQTFYDNLILALSNATAARYPDALQDTIEGARAAYDDSSGALNATKFDEAKTTIGNAFVATRFYSPRPSLATATPQQIVDTLSAGCKLWDVDDEAWCGITKHQ